jgi:hypothetical protein
LLTVAMTGCAKTGRAWVMDNSPYWDLLYEGAGFHIIAVIVGILIWRWLRNDWRFQGTFKPLLAGVAAFCLISSVGLYRGYQYIHTPCTWNEDRAKDCPEYKLNSLWPTNDRVDR